MEDNEAQKQIIGYFIDIALPKLKSITMYARNHHNHMRRGNVTPNVKTRKCLFLALHRLKVKFLIIKNFMEIFRKSKEGLSVFFQEKDEGEITFFNALKTYYYRKNKQNLEAMLPTDNISRRVKHLLKTRSAITNERLLKMATYEFSHEEKNIIGLIMREIKASLFICNFMFVKIDVRDPFNRGVDINIDEEEFMISQDFLPELLPAISNSYEKKEYLQLKDLFSAFNFIMNKVLDGINYAYEIASEGSIILDLNQLYYHAGKTFETI